MQSPCLPMNLSTTLPQYIAGLDRQVHVQNPRFPEQRLPGLGQGLGLGLPLGTSLRISMLESQTNALRRTNPGLAQADGIDPVASEGTDVSIAVAPRQPAQRDGTQQVPAWPGRGNGRASREA